MNSFIAKFVATISALFGLSAGAAAASTEETLGLFWMVHKSVPDLEKISSVLQAKDYTVEIQLEGNVAVLEAKSSNGLTAVVIDKNDFEPLGLEVSYTITQSETDQNYAKALEKSLTARLNGIESQPLPDQYASEDWNSMAWPGEEGSAQTIYVVGYSEKYKATNIWGSQIHSEGE